MSGTTITLSWFLILLALGAVIFFSVFIVAKRSITRRKSRIGRIAYVSCGHGAPKLWKDYVNQKIKATVKVCTEPRVIGLNNADHLMRDSANRVLGFHFRAKTVDHFVDLKELILRLNPDLEAPPVRNLRDFLLSAKAEAILPTYSTELIESYCKLYSAARYDPGPYTEADYFRFLEMHVELSDLFIVNEASQEKSTVLSNLPQVDFQKPKSSRRKGVSLRTDKGLHAYRVMKSDDDMPFCELNVDKCPPISSDHYANSRFGYHQECEDGMQMCVLQNNAAPDAIARFSQSCPEAPADTKAPLSRSGSTASDDSQTALLYLDNCQKTSVSKHDFSDR